jgi:hypothetical protein
MEFYKNHNEVWIEKYNRIEKKYFQSIGFVENNSKLIISQDNFKKVQLNILKQFKLKHLRIEIKY